MLMRLVCFVSSSFATCMGLEQHAALDFATASSTRFAGNLVGSPAFNAQQWRRVVAFSRWHAFLPEVFKQQACHAPTFNMGRNAFFLVAPSLDRGSFVRGQSYLARCSSIVSMFASFWCCWWCMLYMRPCRLANFHWNSSSCVNISTILLM